MSEAAILTHVTVHSSDIDESVKFYGDVFGLESLPTPNFGVPCAWLALGNYQQLHLGDVGYGEGLGHHFGLSLPADKFVQVYLEARERDILDGGFGTKVRRHPAGWIQMWVRDPSGNLVEVDCRDAQPHHEQQITDLTRFEDTLPQAGDQLTASLYAGKP